MVECDAGELESRGESELGAAAQPSWGAVQWQRNAHAIEHCVIDPPRGTPPLLHGMKSPLTSQKPSGVILSTTNNILQTVSRP